MHRIWTLEPYRIRSGTQLSHQDKSLTNSDPNFLSYNMGRTILESGCEIRNKVHKASGTQRINKCLVLFSPTLGLVAEQGSPPQSKCILNIPSEIPSHTSSPQKRMSVVRAIYHSINTQAFSNLEIFNESLLYKMPKGTSRFFQFLNVAKDS